MDGVEEMMIGDYEDKEGALVIEVVISLVTKGEVTGGVAMLDV